MNNDAITGTPAVPSVSWSAFLKDVFVCSLGGILLVMFSDHRLIHLFEKFYRYGYLVFGGGQVVVPVMHGELVEINRYMTDQEFLIGYGLVQGLPGPMFSFAAYAGGMAARDGGALRQILGAAAGVGAFTKRALDNLNNNK